VYRRTSGTDEKKSQEKPWRGLWEFTSAGAAGLRRGATTKRKFGSIYVGAWKSQERERTA